MEDFLFLLPSASGAGSALPLPLSSTVSRDSVACVLEGLAILPATMGVEGRSTGMRPKEGGAATGRSKEASPNCSQAMILLLQCHIPYIHASLPDFGIQIQSGPILRSASDPIYDKLPKFISYSFNVITAYSFIQ
jgi:hypothetical protein